MELIRRDLAVDSAIDESMLLDLQSPAAFPYRVTTPIVLHETHVSWVILAGDYAFKIKKPLKTDFLDYSTLESREHFCHEEIRLDRRYTDDLYLVWCRSHGSEVVLVSMHRGRRLNMPSRCVAFRTMPC